MVLPVEVDDEIFIVTHICHSSIVNNVRSGTVVANGLATWVMGNAAHQNTYRFAVTPNSLGAITYSHRDLELLKVNVIVGVQLTCIDDDRHHAYLASRHGTIRLDRIAERILSNKQNHVEYRHFSLGGGEPIYSVVDIHPPLLPIMRIGFGDYPE